MATPSKIAYLIHTLGFAGAEKHLLTLLPELRKRGVESRLFVVTKHQHLPSLKDFFAGLNHNKISYSVYYRKSRIDFIVIARKLAAELKAENIQILHTHLFNADIVGVLIKKLFHKKLTLISTKHGYREDDQYHFGLSKRNIRKTTYYYLTKYLNKNIDLNISVSQALSEFFFCFGLSKEKMPVIHHGLNPPHPAVSRTFTPGTKIIIVGRLVRIKGHIYLIRALPKIIKQIPDASLLVLGDGPLQDELIAEAEKLGVANRVEFLGFGNPFDYIAQCQVMVAPSIFEAFGFIYLEAFAAKTPLVAFDSGAASEIIIDGENGFLVPVGKSDALAEKVVMLLKSSDLRRQLTQAAYLTLMESFSLEKMAEETMKAYRLLPQQ